jgi:protein TonB
VLKHRFFISLLGTILLHVGIGLLFFYLFNQTIGTEQKSKEKVINFTLLEYEPEAAPPSQDSIKEQKKEDTDKPAEEKILTKNPPIENQPIEKINPEPMIKKAMIKKVVKKKIVKKKRIKKRVINKRYIKKRSAKRNKKALSRNKIIKKRSTNKKEASPARKNKFLNQLRAKISRNKTYPRIAQRRGMQGSVKVRFTILRNGDVSNIQITGKKVFYKSARNAVKKAFPINVKKAPLSLPTTVNLTLHYQIR